MELMVYGEIWTSFCWSSSKVSYFQQPQPYTLDLRTPLNHLGITCFRQGYLQLLYSISFTRFYLLFQSNPTVLLLRITLKDVSVAECSYTIWKLPTGFTVTISEDSLRQAD